MKRRNCAVVITEMLEKIPKTQQNADFIADLDWNREDSIYKSPEETLQWQRTQHTLIKHIPKPNEEWEFEVLSIFTCKPIEELKSHIGKD